MALGVAGVGVGAGLVDAEGLSMGRQMWNQEESSQTLRRGNEEAQSFWD